MRLSGTQSDAFQREDIRSILLAINSVNQELAGRVPEPEVAIYRAGFTAALRAVATALHINATFDPGAAEFDVVVRSRPPAVDHLPQARWPQLLDRE